MPYNPGLVFGDTDETPEQTRQRDSEPSKAPKHVPKVNTTTERAGIIGITRYFPVRAKNPSPPEGRAVIHSRTPIPLPVIPRIPATAPPRVTTGGSLPTTPTLNRTPSRVEVVLQSSQTRKASHSPLKEESEEFLRDVITSDLNQPRRRVQPPIPTQTPSSFYSASTSKDATTAAPKHPASHRGFPGPPATAPVKRRGRPLGWRPGMGAYSSHGSVPGGSSASGVAKKPPATGSAKRRGRPPGRLAANSVRSIWASARPAYIPFLCEWADCKAELHNADTLRRHLLQIHVKTDGKGECFWGKCVERDEETGMAIGPGKMVGINKQNLERHVENEHLIPLTWHVGDGPKNSGIVKVEEKDKGDDGLPAYLFNNEGRQVTPSVRDQQLETEEERKERQKRLRRMLFERDRNAPYMEEMEEPEDPQQESA